MSAMLWGLGFDIAAIKTILALQEMKSGITPRAFSSVFTHPSSTRHGLCISTRAEQAPILCSSVRLLPQRNSLGQNRRGSALRLCTAA